MEREGRRDLYKDGEWEGAERQTEETRQTLSCEYESHSWSQDGNVSRRLQ